MCQKERMKKSHQAKGSLEKEQSIQSVIQRHAESKGRYQIQLLYVRERTVLHLLMFVLVRVATRAYWSMMGILRAQGCSLTCWTVGGIGGGRRLWLIISRMRQAMNQRRQSLTSGKQWHNTEVMRFKERVYGGNYYSAEVTFTSGLFSFDSSITRMQCTATGWRVETLSLLSITILKHYNPKGTSQ